MVSCDNPMLHPILGKKSIEYLIAKMGSFINDDSSECTKSSKDVFLHKFGSTLASLDGKDVASTHFNTYP